MEVQEYSTVHIRIHTYTAQYIVDAADVLAASDAYLRQLLALLLQHPELHGVGILGAEGKGSFQHRLVDIGS